MSKLVLGAVSKTRMTHNYTLPIANGIDHKTVAYVRIGVYDTRRLGHWPRPRWSAAMKERGLQ